MKNEKIGKTYAAATSREKTRFRVLDYLRENIPEGESRRIEYKEIAAALNVSGGAVRYSMRMLALEGAVTFYDGGIRISS